jgi:hypothetical protein
MANGTNHANPRDLLDLFFPPFGMKMPKRAKSDANVPGVQDHHSRSTSDSSSNLPISSASPL